MYKFFSTLVIIALAAWIHFQQQTINDLNDQLTHHREKLLQTKVSLDKAKDAHSLLRWSIRANVEKITSSQPKRTVTVTAYTPRPEETDDSPSETASQNQVRRGIIAVSRDLFDNGWVFGRKVFIRNMGIYTIDDLMPRSKRNHVDILMFDMDKATQFGKKRLEVYLLDA